MPLTKVEIGMYTPPVGGPAFHAYLSANQTVTANTWTKIGLNAETFDTNGCFDSTTNFRFTPTTEGYYQFDGVVTNGGQLVTIAQIYKNGAAVLQGTRNDFAAGGGTSLASVVAGLLYMNGTTDYVELWGYTSGTNWLGGAGTATICRLTGFLARVA